MSDANAAFAAMGEQAEFGGDRHVVPESYYLVELSVGDEPGVSDVKTEGEYNLWDSAGGAPYIQLSGKVVSGGAYKGDVIFIWRHWMSPGAPKQRVKYDKSTTPWTPIPQFDDDENALMKAGGGTPLMRSACRAITGKPANDQALLAAGFTPPDVSGLEGRDKQFAVNFAFGEFFGNLEPADRLDLMLRWLRVSEWSGKTVAVHVTVEPGFGENPQPSNRFQGFYPPDHAKYGAAVIEAKYVPEQEAANAELGG